MGARHRLSGVGAVAIVLAAVSLPPGCSSFTADDTEGDGGDGGTAGEGAVPTDAPFADSGKNDCRPECEAPCVSDPFDSLSSSWARQFGAGNEASGVAGGVFTSIVKTSGGAYLGRRLRLTKDSDIQLSFVAIVDQIPPNGASLAKIVDDDGNEMNVRVDDGQLHACVERKGIALPNNCSGFAKALVAGERIRVTFLATLPNGTRTGGIVLRVDCDPQVSFALPTAGILRTDIGATLHLGLESNGPSAARYDSVDMLPSN